MTVCPMQDVGVLGWRGTVRADVTMSSWTRFSPLRRRRRDGRSTPTRT